jgi:hypothetical protein
MMTLQDRPEATVQEGGVERAGAPRVDTTTAVDVTADVIRRLDARPFMPQ